MTDRRRINGPPSGTQPPVFAAQLDPTPSSIQRPSRTRAPNQLRKIFLRAGLTPSASGSAYLELQPSSLPQTQQPPPHLLTPQTSSLKLTCTVHGPKPLPRSAPFSPNLILSTHVKFAPFASRTPPRRGFVRDALERDLGVHLETALRGVVLGHRWPKSGVDVVITVLEAEDDGWWLDGGNGSGSGAVVGGVGAMTVLAGCITVASAAMLEAGIDCVDVVVGGVAAAVREGPAEPLLLMDPCPVEHRDIAAACVVAYLAARDELTTVWMKGDAGGATDALVDKAVDAAMGAHAVLTAVLKESAEARLALRAASGHSVQKFDAEAEAEAGITGRKGEDREKLAATDTEMSG